MALAMHAAFRGPGAAAHHGARAVGGAHGRHGGHVADDVRVAVRLREHGPGHARRVWLGSEPQALIVIILADVWKTAPFMALLILAGLQVIPGEVYEAAEVDGASAWQRFTKITLPLLTPAILVALIFRTLDALRIFDLPYVLTQGAERDVDVVDDRAGGVRHEPDLRARLGHGGADVHHRDDRLLLVHPLRGREPSRTGGGLGDGSWSRYRTAPRRARVRRPRGSRGTAAKMPWWMWVVVAAIVVFCLFPFYWLINISLKTGNDLLSSSLFPPQSDAQELQGRLQEPRLHQGAAQQRRRGAQHDGARAGRRVVLRLRAGAAEAARASS